MGLPCICFVTHQEVGDRFVYKARAGRTVDLKSFGTQQVWDVVGRNGKGLSKEKLPEAHSKAKD
jgi:hypothetical protein